MNTKNTKSFFFKKMPYWFTLVELIVVITILVILGTIAFLNLGWFSSSARDSSRVSDMANLTKAMDITYLKISSYPIPTNGSWITFSGWVVWTQGTIGDSVLGVLSSAGAKVSRKTTDPKYAGIEYTYSLLNNNKEYQIGTVVEDKTTAISNFITPTFALSEDISAYVSGNYNGLLAKTQTGTTTYYLSIPSIILQDISTSTFRELTNEATQSGNLVVHKKGNLPSSYTVGNIASVSPSITFSAMRNSSKTTSGTGIVAYAWTGVLDTASVTSLMNNLHSMYSSSNIWTDVSSSPAVTNFIKNGNGSSALSIAYNKVISPSIWGIWGVTIPLSYADVCGASDVVVGAQKWAACNVGATRVFSWVALWANDSPLSNESTAWRYFQWGRNVAWDYDGGVASTDNCLWNRDTQSCGASWASAWNSSALDSANGWVDRWNDWGSTTTQGPCLAGYHVPTKTEWLSAVATLSTRDSLATTLGLPMAWYRSQAGGSNPFINGQWGYYWSSSPNTIDASDIVINNSNIFSSHYENRAYGIFVRCIRD